MKVATPSGYGTIPWPDHSCYVYFVYAETELLYVGLAQDVRARLRGHERDRSPWVREATHVHWQRYVSRYEAIRAEQFYIARMNPAYNIMFNSRPALARAASS